MLLLLPLRIIALSVATLSVICLLVDRAIKIAIPKFVTERNCFGCNSVMIALFYKLLCRHE